MTYYFMYGLGDGSMRCEYAVREIELGKPELIKEARKIKEAMKNTDCEICQKHAAIIEKIEHESDVIENQTMRLVINNMRRHYTIKHSPPRKPNVR
jgi:uncharacterized protein Yka (UPF0111/DUF47 family)